MFWQHLHNTDGPRGPPRLESMSLALKRPTVPGVTDILASVKLTVMDTGARYACQH